MRIGAEENCEDYTEARPGRQSRGQQARGEEDRGVCGEVSSML